MRSETSKRIYITKLRRRGNLLVIQFSEHHPRYICYTSYTIPWVNKGILHIEIMSRHIDIAIKLNFKDRYMWDGMNQDQHTI